MIQQLKKKTIFILTFIFWMVLLGSLLVINLSNYHSNKSESQEILEQQERLVAAEGEQVVDGPSETDKKEGKSNLYSVICDVDGTYHVDFFTKNDQYDENELVEIAKEIVSRSNSQGTYDRFVYRVTQQEEGTLISFMDISIWQEQQVRMITYSIIIGIVGMLLLLGVAIILSRWLIRPVKVAFEKQKQFISDAGHELKTPLTIMKASLDMMESQYGCDEHFVYLKEENVRMSNLVCELLCLSRLENEQTVIELTPLDLSKTVEGSSLPFESVVFEAGLTLDLNIEEDIQVTASKEQIRQLVEILLDNAIKHTHKHGKIIVEVRLEKGKPALYVKNEGDPIEESMREEIFDRFFRADKARSHTEGRYGLGLAIASTIAKNNKAKIAVSCQDGITTFSVIFH